MEIDEVFAYANNRFNNDIKLCRDHILGQLRNQLSRNVHRQFIWFTVPGSMYSSQVVVAAINNILDEANPRIRDITYSTHSYPEETNIEIKLG